MEWLAFQLVIILLPAKGLDISTANNQVLVRAVGENVKLDCMFTPAAEDAGPLQVEWSIKSFLHPTEKKEVLLNTAEHICTVFYGPLKGRAYFHSRDPREGDASINILQLTPSNSGFYYCQVKKAPGIKTITCLLRILEPPSKPVCYHTEGTGKFVKTQVLICGSKQGTLPIWYSWTRESNGTLSTFVIMDQTAGTLTIPDASESDTGIYKCTAANPVGKEVCLLEFKLAPPPSVGIIAGVVTGSLATIGIITAVIFFTIRGLRKSDPETSNKHLEDTSSPRRYMLTRGNCSRLDSNKIVYASKTTAV